ncbi:protein DpdE [Phenylobacterium koreense]|uniref:ATP-dependent helicase HepA n=1 Tax=Phenylobacterium koreense TaxID=266125 RepID=A0ABV2EJF4_9CAUL
MFVKAISGELASWGVGKLLSRTGAACIVEYFDAPVSEPILRECLSSELGSISIPAQTRVYAFDSAIGAWEIGRVLDDHGDSQLVKFPNGKTLHLPVANVFVRWDRPIEDPTTFLAAGLTETPRFADGRGPFVRTLLQQRSASLGMSALLSAAIELEAHQVEVVRRVLQDPIQRYLLADEVGLGKTVEAGVLIRQCVLDDHDMAFVVVLVPDALVSQWRSELTVKFFLGDLLDRTVFVEPFSSREGVAGLLEKATMLVVDEAHHITTEAPDSEALYAVINARAHEIERVLLLSATPALHNERGFLRMLHLLDPAGYPLDGEEAFKRRIENRQALAEIVATLTPENSLYLDYALDQLSVLFPDDARLDEEVARLRGLLTAMPADDDPDLVEAIASVRDHLSEVYRLHRRILRHRRRSVAGITPDRAGLEIVRYGSAASSKAADLNEDWRLSVAASSASSNTQAQQAALRLAERRLDYRQRSEPSVVEAWEEPEGARLRGEAEAALSDPERLHDRVAALVAAIAARAAPKVQFLVFCSDPATADALAPSLATALGIKVDRHDPSDEAWRAFNDDPSRQVLVCDRRAEEGLNLQGGEKIVVHFDLPLNPNRVEQRLGRADRYGSGRAVKSLAFCCTDDPLEGAWCRYLDEGLQVFDRSVASLQYLIEQTVSALPRLLLDEGAEGIDDLLEHDGGEAGRISREIKNIDDQDALDALGAPPAETPDALSDADDQWREIETAVDGWVRTTLQFDRAEEPASRGLSNSPPPVGGLFRYKYLTGDRHTLIPLDAFVQSCRPAIDVDNKARGSRDVWTTPYSYRRPTALSRLGRSLGSRVLRYGDPLLTGLQEITGRDERGRSTGVWRHGLGAPAGAGGVHFRFDFIVEADSHGAARALAFAGEVTSAALSSLGRRGDMGLPPFFHTVWLDGDFEEIVDPGLLAALSRPYAVEANDRGGRDFNLNPRRWRILREMKLPFLEEWPEVCRRARERAEECLRALPALNRGLEEAARRAEAADDMRLGLLQARALRTDANDLNDLDLERDLSRELIAGIRKPRIYLDAVTASFIGENQTIAAALARA